MNKAVLSSIRPQYCELIASGKKTVEVRKTRPKLDTPFKCYIYMTAGNASYPVKINNSPYICNNCGGKAVIGEFVCDKIDEWNENESPPIPLKETCLSYSEIRRYGADAEKLYLWHISDLVIYDKPKELSEFYTSCDVMQCEYCEWWGSVRVNADEFDMDCKSDWFMHKPLKRPPQSWCYVEKLEVV